MAASQLPMITLEEHYTSDASVKIYGEPKSLFGPRIGDKLVSLSSARLKDMDDAGVAIQVLSHTPFKTAPEVALCSTINDELHRAVQENPSRFRGFATLPMDNPTEAAKEMRRAVKDLGFVGSLVDTHTDGIWYDGPDYDVVWAAAQDLDVPFYMHPCFASEEMMKVNYSGNYSDDVAIGLGAFVYGWHAQTGLHFLRLFAAGVFDRFPKLKLVLGHMGETLPILLARQEISTGRWTHLTRKLKEVWDTNVYVTTSGMFTTPPLELLLKTTPHDHVLLSIDYPFSETEMGRSFLKDIEDQGILAGDKLVAFASGNAERLLKLK